MADQGGAAARPRTVAVIGASNNRHKYGNKAVRAYRDQGYRVLPIHPHEPTIEGLAAYRSVLDVAEPIDTALFYVPPDIAEQIIGDVARKGILDVWFNPGSESDALIAHARALGIKPILACSIMAVGRRPSEF